MRQTSSYSHQTLPRPQTQTCNRRQIWNNNAVNSDWGRWIWVASQKASCLNYCSTPEFQTDGHGHMSCQHCADISSLWEWSGGKVWFGSAAKVERVKHTMLHTYMWNASSLAHVIVVKLMDFHKWSYVDMLTLQFRLHRLSNMLASKRHDHSR